MAAPSLKKGRPGVCIATCGPGGLNLPNGAAYAYLGGFPMVMIAGQKPILSDAFRVAQVEMFVVIPEDIAAEEGEEN